MKRILNRKNIRSMKNESVEDPHELLLSLVDLGSLDADEALLACVKEMSDAECKRVLGSLSLPNCCDEVEEPAEDDMDGDLVPLDDDAMDDADDDFAALDDADADADAEDEVADDGEDVEECDNRELEAKIRRLERLAFGNKSESKKSAKKEAYRYTREWKPNIEKAELILNKVLACPDVNPDGLTLKDFNKVDKTASMGSIVVYYGDANVDFSAPGAEKILQKYRAYKTYDVAYSDFNKPRDRYFSLTVNTYETNKEWYDPEFGPGFDRDLDVINRRYSRQYGRY